MKLILDNMEKKLNSYSVYNGKFINSISNDTVVSIQQLKDNKWLAYNSPLYSAEYDILYMTSNGKCSEEYAKEKVLQNTKVLYVLMIFFIPMEKHILIQTILKK
ncbi:unknown [Bacteroides sp. CAG:875]|nr:unknown [Bacteroides sp. CAG:875]